MVRSGLMMNLSVIAVLTLTITNVFLTLRLLHLKKCQSAALNAIPALPGPAPTLSLPCNEKKTKEIKEQNNQSTPANENIAFSDFNAYTGRWDNQRLYKFYDFASVGEDFEAMSKKYTVCLATQSSVERLQFLPQVAKHWTGSISVAVFASGDEEFNILQHYVTYLKLCFDHLRRVTFHIAIPKDRLPKQVLLSTWNSFDCDFPEDVLKKLLELRTIDTIKWRLKNGYPQNHMRNLARKGCQTKYVFLTDVDIIPSKNMTTHLDFFLRGAECWKKCAYVIPTYELDLRVKFPENKMQLLRLVKKGLARPFHEKIFIYNQFATNFSRWQLEDDSNLETHVSHNVTNFEFLYEPFYVTFDEAPIHDERFMGYGFTRNSQVYEMYIAGYQFQVLSPIFTCHWGLQQKKTRPAWREQQNNLNRKQFESFKREILLRYKIKTTMGTPRRRN